MSGLTYVGSLSIGALCPLAASATIGIAAGVTAQLQAQIAGLLALQVNLGLFPPSLPQAISQLEAMLLAFLEALALGLPGVDFQLAAIAQALISIQAQLSAILALTVTIGGLFATAGIGVYTYSGPGVGFGPALASELAGGWRDGTPASTSVNAIVLAATTSVAWKGLSEFFAVGA